MNLFLSHCNESKFYRRNLQLKVNGPFNINKYKISKKNYVNILSFTNFKRKNNLDENLTEIKYKPESLLQNYKFTGNKAFLKENMLCLYKKSFPIYKNFNISFTYKNKVYVTLSKRFGKLKNSSVKQKFRRLKRKFPYSVKYIFNGSKRL